MTDQCIETNKIFTFLDYHYTQTRNDIIFALEGGSGSGKTYGAIDFILEYCRINAFENKRIVIARKTYSDCNKTVMDDFFRRLKSIGWYQRKNHTESNPQRYVLFGNEIQFEGLNKLGQHGKRQDLLYINEAMEAEFDEFRQLNQRTNEVVILDWNPYYTEHWIFNNVLTRPDCKYSHSTQLDNPFLPYKQRKEIMAYEPTAENIENGTADDNMWKVYGKGERASPRGAIFPNLKYIDQFPNDINQVYGLDFGFTNHPTALVKTGMDSTGLYGELLCYEPIDNAQALSDMMENLGISKDQKIIADSADRYNDAEMVSDLRQLGWNVTKVNKGKGIKWRIGLMKKQPMYAVHNVNVKREAQNYKWRVINEVPINEPVDKFNHFFDAWGYGYLGLRSRPSTGGIFSYGSTG